MSTYQSRYLYSIDLTDAHYIILRDGAPWLLYYCRNIKSMSAYRTLGAIKLHDEAIFVRWCEERGIGLKPNNRSKDMQTYFIDIESDDLAAEMISTFS